MQFLEENRGSFVSGQDIANETYLTRAAVWKAINALRTQGYDIEAVTNRGYRLAGLVDELDADIIRAALDSMSFEGRLVCLDSVDSTNSYCEKWAVETMEELVVLAEEQTAGRGRRGRNFYSPKGSGLYMSLLLKPDKTDISTSGITAVAAVAVADAIDETVYAGTDTSRIKWVNDIFVDDKKVCGILCEAHFSLEDEADDHLIIGIGINVYEPMNMPAEISHIAGGLLKACGPENTGLRSRLACKILENLFTYLKADRQKILKTYRDKSMLMGNFVRIDDYGSKRAASRYAKAVGIDDNFHLLVEYENGSTDELSSGEVSVVRY